MDFLVRIPFVELLGMQLQRFGGGEAEITLPLREELTNSWSVAHGGVTMTLLDVAMAHAARSPDPATGELPPGVVTIEMKTSFMRPGLGTLTAHGKLLQKTASMAFCEGSVRDEAGTLLAHATGTFKYMKGLPAGGRKIHKLNASD
ncbi:MAG: PaaI family thioesterase [Pseudomonadota bacterium]